MAWDGEPAPAALCFTYEGRFRVEFEMKVNMKEINSF